MKTILVPLDGSTLAEHILPYVQLLAPILAARVRLLRVLTDPDDQLLFPETIAAAYGGGDVQALQERMQRARDTVCKNAEGYLYAQATQLRGHGLDVDCEAVFGDAAEVIVESAASRPGTLIAMATHGRSGLRRWALGSVADKVLHAAETPVLIARGVANPPPTDLAIKRILLPLDGSAFARQALPLAAELAACTASALLLMEAIPPTLEAYPGMRPLGRRVPPLAGMLPELKQQARQELAALAGELRQQDLAATSIVASGHAAEAIVDVAAQRSVDLVVMATHGRSGIRRWALGSIADKVLHTTTTPLLLVRAHEAAS